ncbi:MAG TPA: zf-HC2 domain-containing protein [Mycetocola sp.]|nr:zf-HC2 domain-containing protein [Mycetocola sp.]
MTGTHNAYREWDAAYVLGALSPDERRAFERHLSNCPQCAAAVGEIAGMPGILSMLSPADANAAGGGDPLRDGQHQAAAVQRLAGVVRAERRRARRLMAAGTVVVAATLLTAGIAWGGTVLSPGLEQAGPVLPSAEPADVLEMTPLAPGTLTADLRVTPRKWGTLLAWECRYGQQWAGPSSDPTDLPEYALYVTRSDGTETAVATWRASGERASGLTATTSIPANDIDRVEIRAIQGNRPLAQAKL